MEDVEGVAAELEEIEAGAHEFAEIALLNQLRAGFVELPDDRDEAERLLGARGTDLHSRAGTPTGVAPDELQAELRGTIAALAGKGREFPWPPGRPKPRTRVLVRTAEGLLAAVPTLQI